MSRCGIASGINEPDRRWTSIPMARSCGWIGLSRVSIVSADRTGSTAWRTAAARVRRLSAIGPGQRRSGRFPVAAAAELGGEREQSSPLRARNETFTPPRICSMKSMPDLDAAQADREIDQVFGILRDRAGAQQIVAGDRGVGDSARPGRSACRSSVSPMSLSRPSVFRSKSLR